MNWQPHITVAAVVVKDDQFLMVREKEDDGSLVYNQPAGHLEANETLIEALVRETFEETGWQVKADAILSLNLYTSPRNNITYFRCNFVASPIRHNENATIDPDIDTVLWMSEQKIRSQQTHMRSPLVLQAIDDYRSGNRYPLTLIKSLLSQ